MKVEQAQMRFREWLSMKWLNQILGRWTNNFVCFLSLLASMNAAAEAYHVSTDGRDSNPGTRAMPWRTIQHAASQLKAGDQVLVADGEYLENVKVTSGGKKGRPIRFVGQSSKAKVSSFVLSASYCTIEEFSISGMNVAMYSGAVTIGSEVDEILIKNCSFESSPEKVYQLTCAPRIRARHVSVHGNKFINGQFHALNLYGSGHSICSNFFENPHGWDAVRLLSSDTLVKGNTFTNWSNLSANSNHGDIIQAFSSNGEIATNNIIDGNFAVNCISNQIGNIEDQSGVGVSNWVWRNNIWANVDFAMSMSAPGMKFYNNVFYRSGRNTGGPILFRAIPGRSSGNSGRVFNNVFLECGRLPDSANQGWYFVDQGVTDFAADHNLVCGRGPGTRKSNFTFEGRELHGINGFDPYFVSPEIFDFRLRTNSVCIDSGLSQKHLFTNDFADEERSGSWEIGAFRHDTIPKLKTD